jgi:hypothetical protein
MVSHTDCSLTENYRRQLAKPTSARPSQLGRPRRLYDVDVVLHNIVHVEDGEVYGVNRIDFPKESRNGVNSQRADSSCNNRRRERALSRGHIG